MTGMSYVQASNDWGGSSLRGSIGFARRYPWTVAFLILFFAMVLGFSRVQNLQDAQNVDRADRRTENFIRDQQFCRAIPASAVASAQALVNILVVEARVQKDTERIVRLKKLGHSYIDEARRLAVGNLPECQKLLTESTP